MLEGPAPGHRGGCQRLRCRSLQHTHGRRRHLGAHAIAHRPRWMAHAIEVPAPSPPNRRDDDYSIKVAPHPHTVPLPSEQVLATPAASGRRLWGQLANGGVAPQLRRLRSDREFQVHQLLVPPTLGLVIRFVRGPLTAHHVGVALAPTQLCGQLCEDPGEDFDRRGRQVRSAHLRRNQKRQSARQSERRSEAAINEVNCKISSGKANGREALRFIKSSVWCKLPWRRQFEDRRRARIERACGEIAARLRRDCGRCDGDRHQGRWRDMRGVIGGEGGARGGEVGERH